jgi:subtilisin family serine protease
VQRLHLGSKKPAGGDVFARLAREAPGRFDGVYEVSSPAALATLETALTTHLNGEVMVAINWLFEPITLENEILLEGFTAAGTGFVNAFDLPYLNGAGAARVGVTNAWHLLKAAGILDSDNFAVAPSRMTLAVVDQGFHDAVDLRNPVHNGAPVNTAGTRNCGGSPCPWHGSNVAEIMAARLGNVRAVAGPAGPVADSVILQSLDGYESWSLLGWIAGVADSVTGGPRVANMSFSYSVPFLWIWSTAIYDVGIATLEGAGTLVVAAAGNDGIDIDAIMCPGSQLSDCQETMRRIPCELKGVVCVGAIGNNDVLITGFSAVGAVPGTAGQDGDTVDIYAPGVSILSGADPVSTTGPLIDAPVQTVSGTSEAAPLVAGVAALIAAADPTLTVDELRDRLLLNASTNEADLPPGMTPDPLLVRWLNAERPVQFTLRQRFQGTDFAPRVELVTPRAGVGIPLVGLGTPVPVIARVVDVEDGISCCAPQWTVDGTPRPDLVGASVAITFTEDRNYEIGVSITDSAGQTDSDIITVRARP